MARATDHPAASRRRVNGTVELTRAPGRLRLPARCVGVVVLAWQQADEIRREAVRAMASALARRGLGTLTLASSGADRASETIVGTTDLVPQVQQLTRALDWLAGERRLAGWPVGLLGAGSGAAAALVAAAERPQQVAAVVSLSGRPDLVAGCLARVEAATLLVVGAADPALERINREAWRLLSGSRRMETLPAEHWLLDEPVAWAGACALGARWLERHLGRASPI